MCECFVGYEGAACERVVPGAGCGPRHVRNVSRLARAYGGGGDYALWDKASSHGCACDPGWAGPDCAKRRCKLGVDPLYIDGKATARVSQPSFTLRAGVNADALSGTYAIRFFDVFDRDYVTAPLDAAAGTDYAAALSRGASSACAHVVGALEALPNTVVPAGTVACSSDVDATAASYATYSLTFTGNPAACGRSRSRGTSTARRGRRRARILERGTSRDGVGRGEFVDRFPQPCDGVVVRTLSRGGEYGAGYFGDVDTAEMPRLKRCLGDGDGDGANDVDEYDWDHANLAREGRADRMGAHPHVVKLIAESAHDAYFAGKLALVWWNPDEGTSGRFVMANPPWATLEYFSVWPTDGVASLIWRDADGDGELDVATGATNASLVNETVATVRFAKHTNVAYSSFDLSCESCDNQTTPCLRVGDLLFLADLSYPGQPGGGGTEFGTAELFTVTRLWRADPTRPTHAREDRVRSELDMNVPWNSDDGESAEGFVAALSSSRRRERARGRRRRRGETGRVRVRERVLEPAHVRHGRRVCVCFTGSREDCAPVSAPHMTPLSNVAIRGMW